MTATNKPKVSRFTVTHADTGKRYTWAFFRNADGWILRDHENYERNVGSRWTDAVPVIHMIAENYGMKSPTIS